MDRNQTLLYMIADLYSENKQLKDEVSYLKKDNDDFKHDTEIANTDVKKLIEKVALLEERLGRIKDKLECSFKNKKPLKVEDIGKILLLFQTWEMDKKGAE